MFVIYYYYFLSQLLVYTAFEIFLLRFYLNAEGC